jgi:uncharacterized repeat protein (TIGR03803 family)
MKPTFPVFRRMLLTVAVAVLVMTPHSWGASKYKVLHQFGAGKDGPGSPSGPLILDGNGKFFGNTYSMTFELVPQGNGKWKEETLRSFDGADCPPWGAPILGTAGDLYGTSPGGTNCHGEVFELNHGLNGWSFGVIYSDAAGAIGKLSGTSKGWVYTQLYSYCGPPGCPDGDGEPAPPVWDGKGNLFGTTTDGGISQPACWTSFGCGVIFEMTPNGDGTWTYHVLHRFASYATDGQTPYGGLVMDASGNFYGTTEYGGSKGNGTVFKLSSVSGHWKKTVVYDFPDWHNGALPNSTLVLDKAGNLYGIGGGGNQGCGPYTCGVVFKLAPQKNGQWKYSPVHKFSGPDGNFPVGVIVDDKGNIFGTTANGGTYNSGVAFEITP